MNEIFNFKGQEVRTVTINNEPYFSNSDVCRILEISNPSQALKRLKSDGVISNEVIDNLGRTQEMKFVSESNLYKLIFQSKKKEAESFTDWVTSEVLPQIREQGAYVSENLSDEAFIALFTGQKKLKQKQLELAQDVDYLKNEQPIHPSFAQALLKKRKSRVVMWLGGMDSPAYSDKVFAQSVFREAEMDFKAHFNVSRYDMLPKKFEDAALAYWMTWEPSTNTKMQIYALNSTEKA
ncbi:MULTISPECIES: ORF6C domain-containing protein [Streptococcus]|uniref:Phage associated antirepressor n=1 Tax=Streptococcus dysgalactiae subsp. equisimilis TaxID=119602 RepID=A0AAE9QS19_STREQ|nr:MULTISPECIES: ORF6C domain-containing protein [Streptococcus]HEQ3639603.1 ORF6C domain-containing protein [Streptococcus pyogenes]MDV6022202.1 ORF6C domain-containing protein [Streptococcus canis]VTT17439.1 phage associated antirepressor [Streptococcus dysgalactiae]VTT23323.1 phage associated antirepressor [Streptococcus dysgalactiae subsp. equisimilis]HEQ4253159.1 ORF6C domain-containing protein [Streptococcus pyogenes]